MKQITRVKGRHIGTHYIFDGGYSEAIHYLTRPELKDLNVNNQDFTRLDCFPHWMAEGTREGDWVTTDNGVVTQILRIYTGKDNWHREKFFQLKIVKTVGACGYYVEYIKDYRGKPKGHRYSRTSFNVTELTIAENRARQTLGPGKSIVSQKKLWKRLFVYYLVMYCSPIFAYKLMLQQKTKFKPKGRPLAYPIVQKHAYIMMQDPFVVAELEKYMKVDTFRDRLTRALESQGIGEDRIVQELSMGLEKVKKGTQTHKQFIELAMNISRYAKEKEQIGPDGKALAKIDTVENASYELGSSSIPSLPPPPSRDVFEQLDEETIAVYNKSVDMALNKDTIVNEEIDKEIDEEVIEENIEENMDENIEENIEENSIDMELEKEGRIL